MESFGEITIHVVGKFGNENLNPQTYDISKIKSIFDDVENLLYPDDKKGRPIISYEIKEGSVNHVFKTSRQRVVQFGAVLALVAASSQSLDALEITTAKAFEHLQQTSKQNNYIFELSTSELNSELLQITPQTNYSRSESLWVDAEFYFYGLLIDAGGKNKANIHLDTKEFGFLKINVTKGYLSEIEENPLYRKYGVRVKVKQNVATGEIDNSTMELIELINYNPVYDESYLNSLITKAAPKLQSINADAILREIRGGMYD